MIAARIVFLTNADSRNKDIHLSRLISDGHIVVGVVSSSKGSVKLDRPLALVAKYGARFIIRKIAAKLKAKLVRPDLEKFLSGAGIPRFVVEDINSDASAELITSLSPDILITSTFSQILTEKIIAMPRLGAFNLHSSLLPKYRGPAPVFWALYHNEKETGVTAHLLDRGIDTGGIIVQKKVAIDDGDDIASMEKKLAPAGAAAAAEAAALLAEGRAKPIPQQQDGPYFPRPDKDDWRRFRAMSRRGTGNRGGAPNRDAGS
jgi:folate-dependent phosphoribosylglycinamide formyltransferase PurN